MFFDFGDIKGIGSWAVLLTLLLVVAGFFALPVLLMVGAVYGLALFFGRNH